MKTYVSDDYQITLKDDGCIAVRIIHQFIPDTEILYSSNTKTWSNLTYYRDSENISDLRLSTSELRTLHKALETAGIQYLMDNEIVFV